MSTLKNGVQTLRFNDPKKLNAWSVSMLTDTKKEIERTVGASEVNAIVLTGTGEYYSAGADLAGLIKVMPPRKLLNELAAKNKSLFDMFLDYPKPIFVAVNGPAVGAPVTSASLCDGVFATESASFVTPFAKLGIVPEGCSSVWFERKMNAEVARQMLAEGRKLTALEAVDAGLVNEVVSKEQLLDRTQAFAEEWVDAGKPRLIASPGVREELKQVNERESLELAESFLKDEFLAAMQARSEARGRSQAAVLFRMLRASRPLWARLV